MLTEEDIQEMQDTIEEGGYVLVKHTQGEGAVWTTMGFWNNFGVPEAVVIGDDPQLVKIIVALYWDAALCGHTPCPGDWFYAEEIDRVVYFEQLEDDPRTYMFAAFTSFVLGEMPPFHFLAYDC